MKFKIFGKTVIILKEEEYDKLEKEIIWLNAISTGTFKYLIGEAEWSKQWTDEQRKVFLSHMPDSLKHDIRESDAAYDKVMKILEGR